MTAFKSPPPIEDLSDISWRRVEQGLVGKLDALGLESPEPQQVSGRPTWQWLAGGGALAAAAAALFLILGASERDSALANLPHNSEIITQDSSTELVVAGATLVVAPHSSLALEQAGQKLAITLTDGSVSLKVKPRDHRDPVTVRSGDVHVEVVGTEFAVYRHEEETQVVVYEGIVAVTSKGKRDLVEAGQEWPPEEVAVAKKAKRSKMRRHAKKSRAKVEAPEPHASARELFEEAAAQEQSDPEEALRLYHEASQGQGAWAANALYAQARLELGQGNVVAAHTLLRRYLKRFPEGANAADASELLEQE